MSEWKDIKGYEGLYKISNEGYILSCCKPIGKYITKEKILKNNVDRDGYHKVTLSKNSKLKTHKVHRLVASHFIEESDKQIDHINGIKTDNNVSNLEYVLGRENVNRYYLSHFGRIGIKKVKFGYIARILVNKERKYLGTFKTKEEAQEMYFTEKIKLNEQ